MFQMMGVFAEFERAMIQERVRAGLARAKAEGKRLGRPRIDEQTERAVQAALAGTFPPLNELTRPLGSPIVSSPIDLSNLANCFSMSARHSISRWSIRLRKAMSDSMLSSEGLPSP